ncbi:hypothetical protein HK102_003083 [Quaeritorhiza haematococci]|nr:hypothetical protein HK102_003083 [Quaeritorhiza haematococci]
MRRLRSLAFLLALALVLCHGALAKLADSTIAKGLQYKPHYKQEDFAPRSDKEDPADAYNDYVSLGLRLTKNDPLRGHLRYIGLSYLFEVTDPLHRTDLHRYYDFWDEVGTTIPFYDWLAQIKLPPTIPPPKQSGVTYLSELQKEEIEVDIRDGKLIVLESGNLVNTPGYSVKELTDPFASRWIFVLDGNRRMYVTRKERGRIQHSSIGGYIPVLCAGTISVTDGIINGVMEASGHYSPDDENIDILFGWLKMKGMDPRDIVRASMLRLEFAYRMAKWKKGWQRWKNRMCGCMRPQETGSQRRKRAFEELCVDVC